MGCTATNNDNARRGPCPRNHKGHRPDATASGAEHAADWWLIPPTRQKSRAAASKARSVLEDVFLLVPLHLAHMLRPTGTKQCKCRTLACVNVARELLGHYIRLRCANHACSSAHVGRWDHGANDHDASFPVHQRPSERALVDEAVNFLMDGMDGVEADGPGDGDLQLERTASILRVLQGIDADDGARLEIQQVHADPRARCLQLRAPSLGTVWNTTNGISSAMVLAPACGISPVVGWQWNVHGD
ncbi:hypothetical protein QIS74_09303 [Colletotrichum tabaci]|uniref:Uncharacterized protein n=1 Tax=Colletotrichum tabaci TaxID=1209068 RepID=A0AAV9T4U8_9PEZI